MRVSSAPLFSPLPKSVTSHLFFSALRTLNLRGRRLLLSSGQSGMPRVPPLNGEGQWERVATGEAGGEIGAK